MTGIPPYERPVNMMFQSYALFPHMTVEQNVAFGLKQDGLPKAEIAARVADMLELVKLDAVRASASRTSCRAASASASRSRARWSSVRSCCCSTSRSARSTRSCASTRSSSWSTSRRQLGVTFIVVTHDQEEAMTLATPHRRDEPRRDRAGRHAERIYEYPNSRFVAEFIGSSTCSKGR